MLSTILALSYLAAPAPQGSLTNLRATSTANVGLQTAISHDGDVLFHARGPRVYAADLTAVRAADGLPCADPGNPQYLAEGPYELEASITSLLSTYDAGSQADYLWVGGGDTGIVRFDRTTGVRQVVEPDTGGRWIFDLVERPGEDEVCAVLGARDASQLRFYDKLTGALIRTVALDTSVPGVVDGTAFGAAYDGTNGLFTYVAMGRGGVVRVGIFNNFVRVFQGPTPTDQTCDPAVVVEAARARDVAASEGFLYLASETLGLLSIDLGNQWSKTMPVQCGFTTCTDPACTYDDEYYPVRVGAVSNAGGDTVIAVGCAVAPSLLHEWGNYAQYGGFDWKLTAGQIDTSVSPWKDFKTTTRTNTLFIFDRVASGALREVDHLVFPGGGAHANNAWRSLSIQEVGGKYWIYDEEYAAISVAPFQIGVATSLSFNNSDECFEPIHFDHTAGVPTKLDTNVILTGQDGKGLGHYRINGTLADPTIDIIPMTEWCTRFHVGLLPQGTWIPNPAVPVEFAITPSVDPALMLSNSYGVMRFIPGPVDFLFWRYDYQALPFAPCEDPALAQGRNYITIANIFEPGVKDLVAHCRTGNGTGGKNVALFRHSEFYPPGNPAVQFDDLRLHTSCPPCPTYRSMFFDWETTTGTEVALVVASGEAVANENRAKLVFFNLDDCKLTGDCAAAVGDPPGCSDGDLSRRREAHGPDPTAIGGGAKAFGVTVATINGTQYAFAADTSGSVVAWDLTNLFDPVVELPPLQSVGSWTMAPALLDGLRDINTDLVHRQEMEQGSPVDYLYVAANRRGVVKLEVTTAPGSVTLTEVATINTPGQPTGLQIFQPSLESTAFDALLVFDHGSSGLKLYTE